MRKRSAAALVVAATTGVPSCAMAEAWVLQSGFTARGEYNDNYFLTPTNQQSAFTASVSPFLTAARRTETSDVTALLAIGANKVWGLSENTDYLSSRFGLNGLLREARSTWTGNVSFARAPTLQSVSSPTGIILALAYSNNMAVNAAYTYGLTERWSVGATAGWFDNNYSAVQGGIGAGTLSNNNGYSAGGKVSYAYSERTQVTFAGVLSHYSSDITRGDYVTTTLGVVHQFSPRLTLSASVGEFWSDIEATRSALVCPTTPILCDTGLVPRVPLSTSDQRRDNGTLYGGNISYAFSERTQVAAILSETLAPSATGTLTKTDSAGASLSHGFSNRLTARIGVSYTRTVVPVALAGSSTTSYYQGEIGISYLLAERWKLDAAYRYTRADYSQNSFEPQSNAAFVSVGYNWPGASFTDWVGARLDTQGLPGAGPVPLPPSAPTPLSTSESTETSEREPAPPLPESSPFDQFTIP